MIPHRHDSPDVVAWTAAGIVPVELPLPEPGSQAWAMAAVNGPPTRPHVAIVCVCGTVRLVPLGRELVWDPRQDAAEAPA